MFFLSLTCIKQVYFKVIFILSSDRMTQFCFEDFLFYPLQNEMFKIFRLFRGGKFYLTPTASREMTKFRPNKPFYWKGTGCDRKFTQSLLSVILAILKRLIRELRYNQTR